MLMTPPRVQPYCASKLVVCTLNSPTASAVGTYETEEASNRLVMPSTRTSLVLGRPPSIAMLEEPDMSNGPSLWVDASWITPGADHAAANGLRPISGTSNTWPESIFIPRSAVSVCSASASAATVTDWVTSPTANGMSTTPRSATSSLTPSRIAFLNPGFSTVT